MVKRFLELLNGNANVKRILSKNKNTLTSENTKLSAETLTRLKRAKKHARSCGGARNVNTLKVYQAYFGFQSTY